MPACTGCFVPVPGFSGTLVPQACDAASRSAGPVVTRCARCWRRSVLRRGEEFRAHLLECICG